MTGKITKGIGGFYYIHCMENGRLYECRAKGIFRKDKVKPLVGDNVGFEVIDEKERTGNLVRILPRKNTLIRPAVANIDQALLIFAVEQPKPSFYLLNRFLVMMAMQEVHTVLCFNKQDIGAEEDCQRLSDDLRGFGGKILFTSAQRQTGIDELRALLRGKTTSVAGPSGVGKSSLINLLCPDAKMETGGISRKIDRGRHTTRHCELFCVEENTFIMDTPGFSSLDLPFMEKEELKQYFPEFVRYEGQCRFQGCAHIKEPDCRVREAVDQGEISRARYEGYVSLYEELKERRKY